MDDAAPEDQYRPAPAPPAAGPDQPAAEWLTQGQAAALMSCSPASLLRLERRDPTFPKPFRNGRIVRYSRLALEAYLAAPAPVETPPAWQTAPKPTAMPDYLRPKRGAA